MYTEPKCKYTYHIFYVHFTNIHMLEFDLMTISIHCRAHTKIYSPLFFHLGSSLSRRFVTYCPVAATYGIRNDWWLWWSRDSNDIRHRPVAAVITPTTSRSRALCCNIAENINKWVRSSIFLCNTRDIWESTIW